MPPTDPLFRADPYLAETPATVLSINDRGGVILDRTVFYATGGGQPGDAGTLAAAAGPIDIATAVYGDDRAEIVHVPNEGAALLVPGETITAAIDWQRRYNHMRIHTALHLLSVVLPFPVTGGSISDTAGRLDFDMEGELPDKAEIEARLNALVAADHAVSDEWISDDDLLAQPDLVKTMKVKPPMGTGRVRIRFAE
jgi:misacylated tRNA(Ala) deacylase